MFYLKALKAVLLLMHVTITCSRYMAQKNHFWCSFRNIPIQIKASEMLVAPWISECFDLPWSALVCYSLLTSSFAPFGRSGRYVCLHHPAPPFFLFFSFGCLYFLLVTCFFVVIICLFVWLVCLFSLLV